MKSVARFACAVFHPRPEALYFADPTRPGILSVLPLVRQVRQSVSLIATEIARRIRPCSTAGSFDS